jgi:hypothetical protein
MPFINEIYIYGIYTYKILMKMELNGVAHKLALLMEEESDIPRELYYKYELPKSKKSNEILAILYLSKLMEGLIEYDLDDRVERYFDISSEVIKYASIKAGVPAYYIMGDDE